MNDYEWEFITRYRQLGSDLPAYEREYRFSERKYRFDFAWVDKLVALEVDGGNNMVRWSTKMKRYIAVGRHMKSGDYEKLNLAVSLGWRVLRYTGDMLRKDPVKCIDQVRALLEAE